jgi:hypothetical protein
MTHHFRAPQNTSSPAASLSIRPKKIYACIAIAYLLFSLLFTVTAVFFASLPSL